MLIQLQMAQYDNRLIKTTADHPVTAEEIGEIVGCYGPDAVTRLRNRRDLRVLTVGEVAGKARPRKLYKVERITNTAYCCGYCEQVRQGRG